MKTLLFIFFSALVSAKAPIPVTYVDIEKFSGLWYEVARTYNSYQENCVASSVEYVLQKENEYKVYNRCFKYKIGGDLIEYRGTATPAYGRSMSSIDMTYFYIFTKEYLVIHLENDYSAAVVADKNMEQVWIMSRAPKMKDTKLKKILAKLENNLDLNRLIYTPQDEKGTYK
ncbi:MAG: lipocalin family protein [Campylobacterales bacterium]|nr:lipocalin family protein [Campylobacterales bacterium]